MKLNHLLILATGMGLGMGVSACGGGSGETEIVPSAHQGPTEPTALGTADVLAKTQSQSQTDDPFRVNEGMITLKPVDDETSDPLPVDK